MKISPLIVLFFLFTACAGSKPHGEPEKLKTWVGVWRGVAIIEDMNVPVAEWSLSLAQKDGRLRGRMSSADHQFTRVKIQNLELDGYQLTFTFSYETPRGLQAVQHHVAVRQGHKLLSLFTGREGGRAFRGRWEARYEP